MIELQPLTSTTTSELITSLGALYKTYVPEHPDSPERIGLRLQSGCTNMYQIAARYGITPIPFITLAIKQSQVVGYGLIQYSFNQPKEIADLSETSSDIVLLHKEQDITYQTSCYSFILVHPDYRRQKIGSQLLDAILDQLNHHYPIGKAKSTIHSLFFLADNLEARDFLLSQGGDLTEYGHTYQMTITSNSPQFSPDLSTYSVDILSNPTIDQLLDFMPVYNLCKQSEPRGNDERYDVQEINDWLSHLNSVSNTAIVARLYYHDDANESKTLIGVTDLMATDIEGKIFQRFTGIHPDYRGRGAAKILKQSVIAWIQQHLANALPLIIETETLDNNPAMMAVNQSLGYEEIEIELTIEFYRKS